MKKNTESQKYLRVTAVGIAIVVTGLLVSFFLTNIAVVETFFENVGGILIPFLYGAIIAYILSPLCNRLERFFGKIFRNKKGLCTGLSILFSLLFALFVVVLLILLVVPNLVDSIVQIVYALPSEMQAFSTWLSGMLETHPDLQESWNEFSNNLSTSITTWLKTDLLTTAQSLLGALGGQVMNIASFLMNLFMGILISVYMMASRKKFAVQARLLLCGIFPKKWADAIEEEVHYADRMFNGFLMGRILDSVIVGIICFVFTMFMGFESSILISVIIGVTNVIPLFGPFLGAIPCALLLLLENPLHCLIFLIFIVILQQVDGNLIGPKIVGQKTGVSSFWVLFAVMLFGGLYGLVGMIVGVPVFAVLYDIIRKLAFAGLRHYRRYDLIPKEPENEQNDASLKEEMPTQDE